MKFNYSEIYGNLNAEKGNGWFGSIYVIVDIVVSFQDTVYFVHYSMWWHHML